jgi:hypothetical protein
MIQLEETESFKEENVNKLLNQEYAYLTAEIRLLIIAMNICKERSNSELYLGNEKTYATPRALGLSKTSLSLDFKEQLNVDINNIHSSGLFQFWINNSINHTLLQCIRSSEDNRIKNRAKYRGVNFSVLKNVFLLIGSLHFISVLTFIFELIRYKKNLREKDCIDVSSGNLSKCLGTVFRLRARLKAINAFYSV